MTKLKKNEERIKFHCPRRIALIGLSPKPIKENEYAIELDANCRGWMLGWEPVDFPSTESIEVILGKADANDLHVFAMKDVEGCEVELIVRCLPKKEQ